MITVCREIVQIEYFQATSPFNRAGEDLGGKGEKDMTDILRVATNYNQRECNIIPGPGILG